MRRASQRWITVCLDGTGAGCRKNFPTVAGRQGDVFLDSPFSYNPACFTAGLRIKDRSADCSRNELFGFSRKSEQAVA
jgi:hypothetical protein